MTSFIGRRHELSVGRSLLVSARLVTLTGVGGVGKTRMALRLARGVSRAFPGGVWLVELAPLRDPAFLASTVAAALGLGERAGCSPLTQLSEYLADKRLLLVLDNCEHMIEACSLLSAKLLGAAPDLRILATSRQALDVEGEHVLTVPPLSLPEDPVPETGPPCSEAEQLLVERAVAAESGFVVTSCNGRALARICRRLDGIPLAIELAAVQLRALPAETVLERLDDRFRLLRRRNRGAAPRHQSLQAAIEWSHELCSPLQRLLWARMSVFTGACDLEAIERVCSGDGIEAGEVFELVIGLVNKSVLVRENRGPRSRYRLLETLREFGHEALAASGREEAVRARHFDYYRHLTRRAEEEWFRPRQAEWFTRMRLEQPNLRTALDYSLTETGLRQAGLETAAALHIVWVITGALREGCRWLRQALDLNPEPTRSRAKALHGCAYLLIMLGDIDGALSMLEECQALGETLDDRSALAYARLRTGSARMYQGDVCDAFPLLEDALARQRALDDPFGVYFALRHLTMAASVTGDPRAESFGRECLALCEAEGADLSRSWALWVVGLDDWRRGELDQAGSLVRESLRLKALVGDLAGEAHCVEVLAWVAVSTGEMESAARLFGAARTIWRKVGSSLVEFGYLRRYRDPVERQARQALGDDAYRRLFCTGERLDVDEAIACALGEEPCLARSATCDDEPHLTRREHEVAELVCQGRTNKEIAADLVIAVRTAEGHVENILRKLGFTSRAQIAAWVTRTGKG